MEKGSDQWIKTNPPVFLDSFMAFFVKVYDENPNTTEINKIVGILKKGGLIIYPTDE